MDEEIIEGRFQLHEERLDHYGQRIESLEETKVVQNEAKQQRHGRALEWIVIALVALEAVFEVLMYLKPHA